MTWQFLQNYDIFSYESKDDYNNVKNNVLSCQNQQVSVWKDNERCKLLKSIEKCVAGLRKNARNPC